ncbi:biopolymer transporter ExbD [Sphingomonas ginkgonis]|uniref:Biopolymer transporter ExbD n=1 Tax=Sphingomonas ginkgonis TaxID=2315330 RepID=A0A3R9WQ37_9SPHN|nr:biopolymer transporter ExbD [Sphingomonas ginkgonis]RST31672.1 biopolymer transporter ExbD [Sphingomonas ginkgonis]
MEINTTPLIDVMLVLLIMLIITMPPPSQAVRVDLPVGTALPHYATVNRIGVTNGGTFVWNGKPASEREMEATLAAVAADPALPELQLQPAARARYERVDRLLAMVRRAGVTRMGFVGNEAYARF